MDAEHADLPLVEACPPAQVDRFQLFEELHALCSTILERIERDSLTWPVVESDPCFAGLRIVRLLHFVITKYGKSSFDVSQPALAAYPRSAEVAAFIAALHGFLKAHPGDVKKKP